LFISVNDQVMTLEG